MIGILLSAIASFFGELSGTLEKWMVKKKVESVYAIGFQNSLVSFAFFVFFVLVGNGELRLHPDSFPTLALLAVLAVLQAYLTLMGTAIASRGTFNFIRTGTMPLLLVADLLVGYSLTATQISGIVVVMCALLFLFMNHGIERKGAWMVALSAVNAAITLSLYKWHVTVWNSVAAEQLVVHCAYLLFFLFGSIVIAKENPLKLLTKRLPFMQSAVYAVDSFISSFAYVFAPASVILAATRSSAVLWGILFGNRVFHEKALVLKIATCVVITIGIVLMLV
jgi:hypothetical protein